MDTQGGRWNSSTGKGGGRAGGRYVRRSSEEGDADNFYMWNYVDNHQESKQQSSADFYSWRPAVQGSTKNYYRPSEFPKSPETKIVPMDNNAIVNPPSTPSSPSAPSSPSSPSTPVSR